MLRKLASVVRKLATTVETNMAITGVMMNKQEFVALTGDVIKGLEQKILDIDGDIRVEQISNNTWVFFLSDGNVNSPTEVYEYFNNGDVAKWQYRGIEKKR